VDTPFAGERPQADAMATATPGLAIGILTADCAPVLLADADAGVIGAAHAGWKGAIGGVLQATLHAMESLGAARNRIVAAIGPCIRQPSYEVGPEFRESAIAADARSDAFFRTGRRDRLHFDVPGFCTAILRAEQIARVEALPFDTASDAVAFFSYRRSVLMGEKDYGRQISAIVLE
jgi:YfiH family protein